MVPDVIILTIGNCPSLQENICATARQNKNAKKKPPRERYKLALSIHERLKRIIDDVSSIFTNEPSSKSPFFLSIILGSSNRSNDPMNRERNESRLEDPADDPLIRSSG